MGHGDFDLGPEQWATLRQLLDEVLAREPGERLAWLDALEDPQASYRQRLRELVLADPGTTLHRMDTLPKVETADFAPQPHATMPERVGPYHLLRELGCGGMASVWLAERTDMLQGRQVALKLPHGDWGAFGARGAARRAGLAERMAREREILATLNHPNIAHLYDAGVAEDGQPYLALEYVEGERIDAYCNRHGLDVPARLRLFLQAARAVAHAHANLVVHRDLKPSNILVNAQGEVRLLDFGIAKLLDQGVAVETELTQQGGRALTPDYASPEQIRGEAIGTASDVYSLGVVLYELLTSERPRRAGAGPVTVHAWADLRAEPRCPSAAAADRTVQRVLRGDLDVIIMKALKAERRERYATVDALAGDVQRWIDGRPVLAQPDRPWYRWRKFVGRHRLVLGLLTLLAAAIVMGTALTVRQASIALAEQRRSQQSLDFVMSTFRDADPWKSARRTDALGLLLGARARLEREFQEQPLVRAELLTLVAEALVGLQQEDKAQEAGEAALAVMRGHLAESHPLAIRARLTLVEAHFYRDQLGPTRQHLDQVLHVVDADPVDLGPQRLSAHSLLAQLHVDEDRPEEGERTARAALQWAEQLPQRQPTREIELWRAIALSAQVRGETTKAVDAAQRAFDLASVHYRGSPDHPDRLDTQMRLGRVLSSTPRAAEGLALLERAGQAVVATEGPDSRHMAIFLNRLAGAQADAGHMALARGSAQRALALMRVHYPGPSNMVGGVHETLSFIELASRRPSVAREHAATAMKILDPDDRADGVNAVTLRVQQAMAAAQMGETDHAVVSLERAVPQAARHGAALHTRALRTLAAAQRLAGRAQAARETLQRAGSVSATLPHDHRERAELLAELGMTLLELRAVGDALDALRVARQALGEPATGVSAEVAVAMARAQLDRGNARAALASAQWADAFWTQAGQSGRWPAEAAFWLARCQESLGQAQAARAAYARAAAGLAGSTFPGDATLLADATRKA